MGKVKTTRRERRLQINRFELYKPFVFYAVLLAALNAAALPGAGPSAAGAVALVCGGLLSWGLIEYSIHRWVLHRDSRMDDARLPGNRVHLAHHADPAALDRLNVRLAESIPVCAAYCLLAWAATGSWRSTTFLYDGLMLGYFFYEYLDYQAHHGAARGPAVRYLRRNHLLHHHCDAEARFGVTSPLFDLVFGTYRVAKTSSQ
ncbi:MAG TPA: sterol desaturase family protein [Pyrinomonadaceae bacterium]|nr:sterol desaturase family protein [Pyrinomonadaceae bacterium]